MYFILKNEIIFLVSSAVALSFLLTVTETTYWGLTCSLLVIAGVTCYYSYSYLRAPQFEKLYFYLCMLPLLIRYFALIYKSFGVVTPVSGGVLVKLNWLDSIYFSVVTWTTLGYGDFRPDTDQVKLFVMVEALLGYIYMGVFIGKLLIIGGRNK